MSLTQKYALAFKLIDNPSRATLTSSFRTISRDNKPSYASRYVRDFNDLDYNLPSSFSPRKKPKKSQTRIQFNKRIQNPQKKPVIYKISPPKPNKTINSGIQANEYKIQDRFRQTGITMDTQKTGKIESFHHLANSQKDLRNKNSDLGLCKFEFEKTIGGKIENRYSHHIKFDKSPTREENMNKIWYSRQIQYDSPDRLLKGKDIEKRIHPFKSDSAHQAFTPKETLHRFYDTHQSMKLVKQRSDMDVREMKRVKNRPQLEKKLGTNLQYEKNRSLQNNKKPIFKISRIQRKLTFSRQVISPERGCCR